MGLQQLHGPVYLLIDPLATPAVVGLLEALQADGGHEVLHPQHLPAEVLVDEGAVGEGEELAVAVLFAQGDHVLLPHQGLAAGEDVHIGAQLLALGDDGVQLLQGQVQLVAVLGVPAAGAVHVAGGGGVQQNGPGHVAALPLRRLLLGGAAQQAGVENEVPEEGLPHLRVQLIDLHNELVPVVLFVDGPAEGGTLGAVPVRRDQLIHQVHQLGNIGLRVLFQIGQRLLDGGVQGRVFHFPCDPHDK